MKKKVLINIEGVQYVDNQKEVITQCINGEFYNKNDSYYLLFNHENISNIVKFNKDKVTITKNGNNYNKTKMIIEKDKINLCDYFTQHGVISLQIKGSYINFNEIDKCLKLGYGLLTNGNKISENTISIKIKEN